MLNFINREAAANKLMIKAFEEVYRRDPNNLRIVVQQTRLQETAHDPVVCVVDTATKLTLSQTFNFIDVLGGKQLITPDNIHRFFAVRGVFRPNATDIEAIGQSRREAEIHNFVTRVAPCAGENFAFDVEKLGKMNQQVEEMDKLEVIEVHADTFKY